VTLKNDFLCFGDFLDSISLWRRYIFTIVRKKMTMNVKTDSGVGYLLVDMLRLLHSIVDCASFGLLPEVSLLMGLLTPFWLLAA
jgi:hypothetical protein